MVTQLKRRCNTGHDLNRDGGNGSVTSFEGPLLPTIPYGAKASNAAATQIRYCCCPLCG